MWTWYAPRRASAEAEGDVSHPSLPVSITTIQNKTKKNRAKTETFHVNRNEPAIITRRTEEITKKNLGLLGRSLPAMSGWGVISAAGEPTTLPHDGRMGSDPYNVGTQVTEPRVSTAEVAKVFREIESHQLAPARKTNLRREDTPCVRYSSVLP